MKRIITILFAGLLLGFLVFVFLFANSNTDRPICRELIVILKDSTKRRYIEPNAIVASLKNSQLYPVDRFADNINTDAIEKHLLQNKMVASADVYKTVSGAVKIIITQKTPVLRVFGNDGSYYIDVNGEVLPADVRFATYLPVATGNIEKSLAKSELYKFALFLQKNAYWNEQIEQIYVHPNKEVELVPRVGNHRIILGDFSRFEEKMDNLRRFYEQAIPKIGWEKYDVINLKYRNQIVCTKK
ncbi:MAG: cell division protein FtsQ/DivIB [Tannerella sp.]|jgi:cell division protein FtsQ|nr:cell division protein FtsQ/DivIB [Tannerella sp.]